MHSMAFFFEGREGGEGGKLCYVIFLGGRAVEMFLAWCVLCMYVLRISEISRIVVWNINHRRDRILLLNIFVEVLTGNCHL